MDTINVIKESLIFIAVTFIGYGTSVLSTDFVKGSIALILGAVVIGIRGYLKSKQIDIDRSN